MNEQLQGKLVEILTGIQAATKVAGDFAMEQLPDIAQQYVMYGRAYTLTLTVMSLLIFLSGFLALNAVKKRVLAADEEYANQSKDAPYQHDRRHYFEASDIAPVQYAPFALGAVFFTLSFSQTLLVWVAPKVWLLKELASLIK